jgi:ribosomal-protein-alanine N-acetyltransferase
MIPDGLPIVTERLVLDPVRAADVDGPYSRWFDDPEVVRHLETAGPLGRERIAAFVESCIADPATILLAIRWRSGSTHIGNVKLGPIVARHAHAGVGIVVGDRAFWGRGVAREVLAEVSRFAFATLPLEKLIAGVVVENLGSIRAFEAAGFQREALRRRHFRTNDGRLSDVVELARFRDPL